MATVNYSVVIVCHLCDMLAQCGCYNATLLLPNVAIIYACHSLCLSLLWHVGPVCPLLLHSVVAHCGLVPCCYTIFTI